MSDPLHLLDSQMVAEPPPESSGLSATVKPVSMEIREDYAQQIRLLDADNLKLKQELADALKENTKLKRQLSDEMQNNSLLKDLAARKTRAD